MFQRKCLGTGGRRRDAAWPAGETPAFRRPKARHMRMERWRPRRLAWRRLAAITELWTKEWLKSMRNARYTGYTPPPLPNPLTQNNFV